MAGRGRRTCREASRRDSCAEVTCGPALAPPPAPPGQRTTKCGFELLFLGAILIELERENEAEHRASPDLAHELDFTLKHAREFLADRQPQARARVLAGVRGVELLELLEEARLIFGRDSGPRVDHAHADLVPALRAFIGPPRQLLGPENDSSAMPRGIRRRRELHRVAQTIEDHVLKELEIGFDNWEVFGGFEHQFQALLLSERSDETERPLARFPEVDR